MTTAPVDMSVGDARGGAPRSESHRYEPSSPFHTDKRPSDNVKFVVVTIPASGKTMGESVLPLSSIADHFVTPPCPVSATSVADDVTKYAELSGARAGGARMPPPSVVLHFVEPDGLNAIATPASVPVMMLPSLLTTGDVDDPPIVGVTHDAAPVVVEKDPMPTVVPAIKLEPPERMAGDETDATPELPPP